MSGKVQIATFYEQTSKNGEPYLKATFGPFDLLLFKDASNVAIGKDGQRTCPWNLVLSENNYAKRTGRPMVGLGDPVPEDKAPDVGER